jgi:hypothetical protein
VPDTKATTTLSWDVRGLGNGTADLQGDFGTGVWQDLGPVYDTGSRPAQIVYTGSSQLLQAPLHTVTVQLPHHPG